MKTIAIIIGAIGTLSYIAIIIATILRAEAKWWRCAWCRAYFSEAGEILADLPVSCDGVVGHGCCHQCAAAIKADAVEAQFRSDQLLKENAAYNEGGGGITTGTTAGRTDTSHDTKLQNT